MSEHHDQEELNALARALAALRPADSGIDRDALMFQAGRAAASPVRRGWLWPFATFASAGISVCLAVLLFLRPVPGPQIRHIQGPATTPKTQPAPEKKEAPPPSELPPRTEPRTTIVQGPELSWLRMQQIALRFGVEALPTGGGDRDGSQWAPPSRIEDDPFQLRQRPWRTESNYFFGEP